MSREKRLYVLLTSEQTNIAAYLRGSGAPQFSCFSVFQFWVYLSHALWVETKLDVSASSQVPWTVKQEAVLSKYLWQI